MQYVPFANAFFLLYNRIEYCLNTLRKIFDLRLYKCILLVSVMKHGSPGLLQAIIKIAFRALDERKLFEYEFNVRG